MNELPVSTEPRSSTDASVKASPKQTEPPVPPTSLPPNDVQKQRKRVRLLTAGLAIMTVLLVAQWWSSHVQIRKVREEIARRLQVGESTNTETKVIAKAVQDDVKEMQGKITVLENKQTETQNQQVSLAQLYQDLSKNRDDWALAEIEQVLSTANQQLQLSGNIQGALIALQNADKTLSRSEKPQFIVIRRALAKDMERLRAFPVVDMTGAALKLDTVVSQIHSLPLLSSEKPAVYVPPKDEEKAQPAETEETASTEKGRAAKWLASVSSMWRSWTHDMWNEMKTLVRVRNVDTPDALMLSPNQASYLREHVELRLLSARLGLLSRNDASFRSDMRAAQNLIGKYFDPASKQTQAILTILKQVEASNLSVEMPTLTESLTAVQNYRAKP